MSAGARKEVWATAPRGEGKKDFWIRVGTAFENRDGSWSIVLDVLPTNARLIVRDPSERDDDRRGGGGRDEEPRGRRQETRNGGGRRDDDEIPF